MSTPHHGPLIGAPGDTPRGQASEIHWPSFRVIPPRASSFAGQVDTIALVWTIFSVFIITLVFGMMVTFCLRFHSRKIGVRKLRKKTRSAMEWSWTVVLLMIALGIGFWADKVYLEMHSPPPNAAPVYVIGKQWMWKFQHADGTREINELHVPLGEPIKLIMSSQDVIHSLYIPAFRIKQDVLPGRYSYLWFKATRVGVYRLFCSEYCGTSHAAMNGKVVVMRPEDFETWKETHLGFRAGQSGSSLASRGRELFTSKGCISCHGTVGRIAPALQGLYMSKVGLRTGESVIADDNYIRQSILDPGAKIVKGYQDIMPTFKGQVSEEDLQALIAYIKTLQYYDTSQARGGQNE